MPAKGIRAWRCCAVRRQSQLLQGRACRWEVGVDFEVDTVTTASLRSIRRSGPCPRRASAPGDAALFAGRASSYRAGMLRVVGVGFEVDYGVKGY